MSLRQLGFIDLPEHVKPGGFDHAAVDLERRLLYLAHTANNALDVVDCTAGRLESNDTAPVSPRSQIGQRLHVS